MQLVRLQARLPGLEGDRMIPFLLGVGVGAVFGLAWSWVGNVISFYTEHRDQ
jgi:hypothetical protein